MISYDFYLLAFRKELCFEISPNDKDLEDQQFRRRRTFSCLISMIFHQLKLICNYWLEVLELMQEPMEHDNGAGVLSDNAVVEISLDIFKASVTNQ